MAIPREIIKQVRRLDEYDLRRLMILVRGLLLAVDGEPEGPVDEGGGAVHVTYRQEHVRCNKAGCTTCPHGPYWYAYWKEDGRTRSQYIGRHLPGEPLEPVVVDRKGRAAGQRPGDE